MARGRMISKAISLDEKVNALSDDTARLLFTWLITHLDCEGRMHGDPVTVKSIVFPRRNISPQRIEKYLAELEKTELIFRYSINGNQYLCAPTFEKHQMGLRKNQEAPSQIPPFTTDLQRSKNGLGLLQVKTKIKVKEETKEESIVSLSIEDVFEVYKKEVMGSPDESASIPEDMEGELKATIKIFSAPWVINAIREAVKHKRRDWRYIVGILRNWEREEREAKFPSNKGPRGKQDPDKYIKGKYGHMVQR